MTGETDEFIEVATSGLVSSHLSRQKDKESAGTKTK